MVSSCNEPSSKWNTRRLVTRSSLRVLNEIAAWPGHRPRVSAARKPWTSPSTCRTTTGSADADSGPEQHGHSQREEETISGFTADANARQISETLVPPNANRVGYGRSQRGNRARRSRDVVEIRTPDPACTRCNVGGSTHFSIASTVSREFECTGRTEQMPVHGFRSN